MRKLLLAVAIAAVSLTPAAQAGPGMFVGVNDDTPKWKDEPAFSAAVADLGISSFRITMRWDGTQSALTPDDRLTLDRILANVHGARVLLSVFGKPDVAPRDETSRAAYCAYVGDILTSYPAIRDIGIWNEVNKASFWRPQYTGATGVAPADYVKLLSACYLALKPAFPEVSLVTSLSPRGNDNPNAKSNVSHSPGKFIESMGAAYRAMSLTGRIFDHFGQNVYGTLSGERPYRAHPNNTDIGQGDYAKLMRSLARAFSGTAQPVPGTQGVTVWYLETGFQSSVAPDKSFLYTGTENDAQVLLAVKPGTDPTPSNGKSRAHDQATQLVDSIRLAYCQPAVGAYFNFHLADEPSLEGWQSGVLWTDYTPKPSYDAFKSVVAEVNAGTVDCAALKVDTSPVEKPKPAKKRKKAKR